LRNAVAADHDLATCAALAGGFEMFSRAITRAALLSGILLAGLVVQGRAMELDPRRLMALNYQDSLSAFGKVEGAALALVRTVLENEGFAQSKTRTRKNGEKLTLFTKQHETGEMYISLSSIDGMVSQYQLISVSESNHFNFNRENFGVHQFASVEHLVISADKLFGTGYALDDFAAVALSGGFIVVKSEGAAGVRTVAFARTPFPKGSLAARLGGNASPNMPFAFCASQDPAAPEALIFTTHPGSDCDIPWNDYIRAARTALARE
jgi:hypothetical protein